MAKKAKKAKKKSAPAKKSAKKSSKNVAETTPPVVPPQVGESASENVSASKTKGTITPIIANVIANLSQAVQLHFRPMSKGEVEELANRGNMSVTIQPVYNAGGTTYHFVVSDGVNSTETAEFQLFQG